MHAFSIVTLGIFVAATTSSLTSFPQSNPFTILVHRRNPASKATPALSIFETERESLSEFIVSFYFRQARASTPLQTLFAFVFPSPNTQTIFRLVLSLDCLERRAPLDHVCPPSIVESQAISLIHPSSRIKAWSVFSLGWRGFGSYCFALFALLTCRKTVFAPGLSLKPSRPVVRVADGCISVSSSPLTSFDFFVFLHPRCSYCHPPHTSSPVQYSTIKLPARPRI
jgi:hypothetical protein